MGHNEALIFENSLKYRNNVKDVQKWSKIVEDNRTFPKITANAASYIF